MVSNMPETSYGLPAFLRLASLPSNKMISEMKQRKYGEGGDGPPTTKAIRRAMQSVFYHRADPGDAERLLLASVPRNQQAHIQAVFRRYCRLVRRPIIHSAPAPIDGFVDGPNDLIRVSIAPEIGYNRIGATFVVLHWSTKLTLLSVEMRRMGYALIRQACARGAHAGSVMSIQDLVEPRFGSEISAAAMSIAEASAVIGRMEQIWEDIEEDTRPMEYVRTHHLAPLL